MKWNLSHQPAAFSNLPETWHFPLEAMGPTPHPLPHETPQMIQAANQESQHITPHSLDSAFHFLKSLT